MKRRFLLLVLTFLTFAVSMEAANKRFTLVIDAGHGGKDYGAMGKITNEKSINLKVALAFGRMVERRCPDVKVIYTRKSDVFLTLYRRAEIANQNKADVFISIHTNALAGGHVARGVQTFALGRGRVTGNKRGILENLDVAKRENSVILLEKDYKKTYRGFDPNSPESNIMFEFIQDNNMEQSVELAKMLQRRICSATGRQNMGTHQDNLAVLRLSSMPGCLVELGFITTADEERFMNNSDNVEKYAKGLFQAFTEYKKKHSPDIVVPYKAEQQKEIVIPQIVPQKEKAESKQEKERVETEQPKEETAEQPQPKPQSVQQESEAPAQQEEPATTEENKEEVKPIFKVQILTSDRRLRPTDQRLKGVSYVDYYEESNLYKYTVGASTDYQEIYQLRKKILGKFPQAFIIAFKNSAKMNVNEAIKEYKANKAKGK